MAFDPSKYTVAKARPLPVILMLDGSGSMTGEKIATLNAAVNEMINSFKKEAQNEVEIQVGIIAFGDGGAQYVLPLQSSSQISNIQLGASGGTPMGMALKMAKDLIEDKDTIPSRGYRPTVVLVSDGQPNDSWEQPMQDFITTGRSAKCDRLAMEIKAGESGEAVLNKFLEGTENRLFHADEASKIKDFFRFVTMSVSVRSKSADPNKLLSLPAMDNNEQKMINNMMDF